MWAGVPASRKPRSRLAFLVCFTLIQHHEKDTLDRNANFLVFDFVSRFCGGTNTSANPIATGLSQFEISRPPGLDERSAGRFGTIFCRRADWHDFRPEKRF